MKLDGYSFKLCQEHVDNGGKKGLRGWEIILGVAVIHMFLTKLELITIKLHTS